MKFAPACAALAALLTLAGCGGGGDDSVASSSTDTGPDATQPAPTVPSNNSVERTLVAGVNVLWGFGFTLNNVPQVFIGQNIVVAGQNRATKIAGVTTSPETPPSLLDVVSGQVQLLRNGALNACTPLLSFAGSTDAAEVACTTSPSTILWTLRLVAEDVAGKPVAGYVRNALGTAVGGGSLDAGVLFGAGSVAYTAEATAREELIVVHSYQVIVGTNNLVDRGWCNSVPGATYRLGVLPRADRTVSLYDVPTATCSLSGLMPVATGSWVGIAPTGSYRLTFPDAVRNDAKWNALFAGAATPTLRAYDVVVASGTSPRLGNVVAAGESVRGLQPQFNAAALPALKAAARVQ